MFGREPLRWPREVLVMMDFVALGLTVAFFAISVGFVALCDRL